MGSSREISKIKILGTEKGVRGSVRLSEEVKKMIIGKREAYGSLIHSILECNKKEHRRSILGVKGSIKHHKRKVDEEWGRGLVENLREKRRRIRSENLGQVMTMLIGR